MDNLVLGQPSLGFVRLSKAEGASQMRRVKGCLCTFMIPSGPPYPCQGEITLFHRPALGAPGWPRVRGHIQADTRSPETQQLLALALPLCGQVHPVLFSGRR